MAVSTWLSLLFLAFALPLARSAAGYTGPQATAPTYVKVTWGLVLASMIFVITRLLQLRPIGVWFSAAIASMLAITSLARLPMLLATGTPRLTIVLAVSVVTLNGASAWYLTRPWLHATLERRRNERETEAMRRVAEEQVRRSAGS